MNLFDIFGSKEPQLDENLRKWFKDKWVRFGPDGEIRGDCARGDDSEGKPKCLPQSKAQNLGKKGRASAAARKRREDPNPERSGKAINVATKKKSNEGMAEGYNDLGPEYGGAYVNGRSDDAKMTARLTRQAKAAAAKAGKTFGTSAEYRKWHARQKEKEGVAEAINPDITNPEFSHQQQIGDYLYVARYWSKGLKITAYHGNKQIGYAELMYQSAPFDDFADPKTTPKRIWLESEWTRVDPKYQRQGIMSTMYAYAKMLGNSVKPSQTRSDDAKAAWKSWRDAGDAQHLTREGVAEGSENLNYIGNCTDDDVIEHIFGDATGFAQAVDEYGDEFTLDDLVVKYDPETDVHSFYYKEQGVAEGSDGWIGNPAKWKEAVLQAHGPDVVFKNYSHPGQPGKRSVNAINAAGKQVGVYQRHNKMGMVQPNMQGVAEAFGPLPREKQQIRLGRHTVDIERVGLDKNYISFAWHDSQGQEHYEEVAVGDLGSYDDLIDKIKQEIKYQERQYTDQGVAEEQLDELSCWSGYHRVAGTKAGFPGSCAKNKTNESEHSETCPHCGGEMFSEELINEKKDACYYKVKSRYKVWPSAYASGALVKCRKKGADSWGNKSEGVAEAPDSNFVGFMNKALGQKTDTPLAKSPMPDFMKGAPIAGLDSMGYRAALNFGMKTLTKLTPTQKTKLSIKGEDGVVNWLASQARKQGLLITDEDDEDTQGKFMQEDLEEVQDFLPEVFKDPAIKSWAFVLTDGDPLPKAPVAGPFSVSINPGLPNDDGYANSDWKTLDTLENLPDAIQLAQGLAQKNPKQFVGIWAANGKSAGFYWPGQGWRGLKEGAPIVVAQAPIDVRNPKKAPQAYRNQGDIVPPTKPPSTEKRGVKGRPGQRSMPDRGVDRGVAEDQLDEKWSQEYKDSINCSNPKGFSQKAHCAGQKKNEDIGEGKEYYTVMGTDSASLRRDFNMSKDRNGWYLREGATPKQKLEAFRAFGSPKLKEFNLAAFSGGTQTKGDDNVISPVGSIPNRRKM